MKKVLLGLLLLLTGFLTANAQAFENKATYLTLGIGGARYYYLGSNSLGGWANTGELSVQAEWGVHKYVGVGLFAGIGGGGYSYDSGNSSGIFNIPVGAFANFHFYQLIAENVSKNIYADKIDVYAGASIGTGLGVLAYSANDKHHTALAGMIWGGMHVGARYWFTPKLAVNLEAGMGKTFINGGITFKL